MSSGATTGHCPTSAGCETCFSVLCSSKCYRVKLRGQLQKPGCCRKKASSVFLTRIGVNVSSQGLDHLVQTAVLSLDRIQVPLKFLQTRAISENSSDHALKSQGQVHDPCYQSVRKVVIWQLRASQLTVLNRLRRIGQLRHQARRHRATVTTTLPVLWQCRGTAHIDFAG